MSEAITADFDIEAREQLILGHPVRITPMTDDEITDEALEYTGRLRQMGSRRPTPTDKADVPVVLRIMFRHIKLYEQTINAGIQLTVKNSIPSRDSELAILRVGWLSRAPYEWGEHVKKARERYGISAEEVEAVTIGSTAPNWSRHDRAILRAVEELRADSFITDETWATLAETFDDQQMIELPILIGHYTALAYSQNSLRLPLQGTNIGLKAR